MITVDRRQFSRAIKLASAVVEKRATIPILTGVKITANGALVIEGTNLDSFSRAELAYEGDAGEFFLEDPRGVVAAINAAGGDTVELTGGESNRVTVRAGQLHADLRGLPADDHPGAERIVEQTFGCTVGATELAQIRRVMTAISTDECRYYLNGVHAHKVADWTYRFVATDGHRLMLVDVPLPDASGELPDSFIIPRRFLNQALNSFANPKDGLAFRVGRSAISNRRDKKLPLELKGTRVALSGTSGGTTFELTGKLIDGTFPDYTRVFPADLAHFIRCTRAELAKAINSLTPLSTERTRAVRLFGSPGKLSVELKSPDKGDSRFEIDAEHNLPADFSIGFNGQYLLDMVAALTGDEIEIGLNDPAAPAVITDPADTAFKGVLMPMRV